MPSRRGSYNRSVDASSAPEPDCYYAATAQPDPPRDPLRGEHRADVAVVGAGFTGVASALTLAERGYSVCLLEAGRIGWAASGRNGGQIIGGISGQSRLCPDDPDLVFEMAWRGNDIVYDRIERFNIDCDLRFGYVDAALKSRQLRALEADYDELNGRDFPYDTRLLGAREISELLGTDRYRGGLFNGRSGHLHPLNLCRGEARAAEGLGVSIFESSQVQRIDHGRWPRVVTDAGSVVCEAVVLAGNTHHDLEAQRLAGTVFPAGSFIIATEPLPPEIAATVNPQRLAVCDQNVVLDYFRTTVEGRLLFGGRCNYSGRRPKDITATLRPRMLHVYPQLHTVAIDYAWGGDIGIAIRRVPVMGAVNGNVFYAQGYSGHGINVSHLAGEILADAVGGTLDRLDVFARIPPIRLPVGRRLGGVLMGLGMLYYRAKDLI